jgi:hypothetical protein
MREEGIPDLAADKLLPPLFRKKLLAYAKERAGDVAVCIRPMSVEHFVWLARRPMADARMFRELEAKAAARRGQRFPRRQQQIWAEPR